MRLLTALVLAFVVCIGLPTLAAADTEPVSLEQRADSADAGLIEVVAPADFDATLAVKFEPIDGVLQAPRASLPTASPARAGPQGFSPGIWRPVDRADSTLIRNYESGLAINHC